MMEKRLRILTFMVISITVGVANVRPQESSCMVKMLPRHKFMVNKHCKLVSGIPTHVCIGACKSYDRYPIGYEGASCSCCQPISFRQSRKRKRVICLIDGTRQVSWNTFLLREPTKCECKPCSRLT